jgi:GTPase
VRVRLKVKPFRTWYYCISPNSHTLVILLQVDLTFSDELETVCEGCYETENTSIFAWSSVPGVGHYRWLRGSIRRLLLNNKVDYLVHTIRRILNFL